VQSVFVSMLYSLFGQQIRCVVFYQSDVHVIMKAGGNSLQCDRFVMARGRATVLDGGFWI